MKQDVQKLLYWLIPVVLFSVIAQYHLNQFVIDAMGAIGTTTTKTAAEMSWLESTFTYGQIIAYSQHLVYISKGIVYLTVGLWLFFTTPKYGLNRWLFLALGLLIKFWAVGIFLALLIYENTASKASQRDAA